jgi:hypothetical protein
MFMRIVPSVESVVRGAEIIRLQFEASNNNNSGYGYAYACALVV